MKESTLKKRQICIKRGLEMERHGEEIVLHCWEFVFFLKCYLSAPLNKLISIYPSVNFWKKILKTPLNLH